MNDERVVLFIDGSNFYHCAKKTFNKTNVDFLKFAYKLCNGRKLIRIYYYNCTIQQAGNEEQYKRQQRFLESLKRVDYLELRLGRLEPRDGTFVEKGVDVKIATDMIKGAFRDVYDTAILISGDADFSPAVDAVKDSGKHVENAFVKYGQANQLKQSCDRFVFLSEEFMHGCWLY